MVDYKVIIFRLILATFVGALVGLERESIKSAAGLRTHILVTVGSTLMVSVSMYGFLHPETGMPIGDPARVAAQVVSGIGFLGAGTILRTGNQVKGLTTAASLWICAGIGLAIGSGFYLGGLVTAAIVVLTLGSFRAIEKRYRSDNTLNLKIFLINRLGIIGEVGVLLGRENISIMDITINESEEAFMTLYLQLKSRHRIRKSEVCGKIREVEGVLRVDLLDEDENEEL